MRACAEVYVTFMVSYTAQLVCGGHVSIRYKKREYRTKARSAELMGGIEITNGSRSSDISPAHTFQYGSM